METKLGVAQISALSPEDSYVFPKTVYIKLKVWRFKVPEWLVDDEAILFISPAIPK